MRNDLEIDDKEKLVDSIPKYFQETLPFDKWASITEDTIHKYLD